MTLASIGTFREPKQSENPEKLEQPITTSGIMSINANSSLNNVGVLPSTITYYALRILSEKR